VGYGVKTAQQRGGRINIHIAEEKKEKVFWGWAKR
jgi:hypothetical protein